MSSVRILSAAALVLGLAGLAAPAGAVGLFECVDAVGNQVCVIDTGNMTQFSPSGLCNASCPPCAGRCDAAPYYPSTSGHWEESWQVAPGITGNNILTPGANPQEDARTIVREGLAAPAAPPVMPPSAPPAGTPPYAPAPGY